MREESIFEGVDITETPCTACGVSGISKEGKSMIVDEFPVSLWLDGRIVDICPNADIHIRDLPLCHRIRELNKRQINGIIQYMEG